MPSIEACYSRFGDITGYRFTVCDGSDKNGKPIRHRLMWCPPDPTLPEQQLEVLAWAEAYKFEQQIKYGYRIDSNITFEDYADYVLDEKARIGVKPSTIERYRSMLPRINKEIGDLKVTRITPFILNDLYRPLAGHNLRADNMRAVAKSTLTAFFAASKMSRQTIAKKAQLSPSTVGIALKGSTVTVPTATVIAKALGFCVNDLFTISSNIKPLSNKTILEHHRLISTIFTQAEKEMIITMNPAARASPPRAKTPPPTYYQPEEMDEILDALEETPPKWKAITYLLIDTGCRRGEIMGLKWKDINFKTGVIIIDSSFLYSEKLGIYEGDTKTGDFRAIKLARQSLAVLSEWKKEYELWEKLNGDRWVDSGFVFVQDNGAPMHPDSITDWLNKFGIEHHLPHLNSHAFRHPYVKHTTKNIPAKAEIPNHQTYCDGLGFRLFQLLNRS